MKFKKSQSGRSMVEMLGVLAIIGVLSVGGIAGYSLSMRRHRANQVVDYISKFALDQYATCRKHLLDAGFASYNCVFYSYHDDFEPDIGNFPSGVTHLWVNDFLSINKGDIIDGIEVYTEFSDQKLCQATASIAGATCIGGFQLFSAIKID